MPPPPAVIPSRTMISKSKGSLSPSSLGPFLTESNQQSALFQHSQTLEKSDIFVNQTEGNIERGPIVMRGPKYRQSAISQVLNRINRRLHNQNYEVWADKRASLYSKIQT